MAGGGDCEQYRHIIERYDWHTETAMRVCQIESGGNPTAANWNDSHQGCSGSFGLFQVGCLHGYSKEQLERPIFNINVAYKIYKKQGWWGGWKTTMNKLTS